MLQKNLEHVISSNNGEQYQVFIVWKDSVCPRLDLQPTLIQRAQDWLKQKFIFKREKNFPISD